MLSFKKLLTVKTFPIIGLMLGLAVAIGTSAYRANAYNADKAAEKVAESAKVGNSSGQLKAAGVGIGSIDQTTVQKSSEQKVTKLQDPCEIADFFWIKYNCSDNGTPIVADDNYLQTNDGEELDPAPVGAFAECAGSEFLCARLYRCQDVQCLSGTNTLIATGTHIQESLCQ